MLSHKITSLNAENAVKVKANLQNNLPCINNTTMGRTTRTGELIAAKNYRVINNPHSYLRKIQKTYNF